MLALVLLGLMAGVAVFVFLWTSRFGGWSFSRAGVAVVPLSLLAGIGFSAARLFIGGMFVRLFWSLRWNRAARELAHIRIMSASMWALMPEALIALLLGVWFSVSLQRPLLVLIFPFAGNILTFGVIVFFALSRLRGTERTCDRCGYMLQGLPDPRCPECGEPFPVEWTEPHFSPHVAGREAVR
jgi:hypothetical protein